jgi:site-specific DNA-methyltransferase (adenine-specific)
VNNDLMFSSGKDDWGTPPALFDKLHAEFRFKTDAAAHTGNSLLPRWFGPGAEIDDALSADWRGLGPFYCNPPYSRGLQHKFVAKAALERRRGETIVMLLPARTDTVSFHAHIWDCVSHEPRTNVEVRFLPRRIKFVGATAGAPFPSMVIVFRGSYLV